MFFAPLAPAPDPRGSCPDCDPESGETFPREVQDKSTLGIERLRQKQKAAQLAKVHKNRLPPPSGWGSGCGSVIARKLYISTPLTSSLSLLSCCTCVAACLWSIVDQRCISNIHIEEIYRRIISNNSYYRRRSHSQRHRCYSQRRQYRRDRTPRADLESRLVRLLPNTGYPNLQLLCHPPTTLSIRLIPEKEASTRLGFGRLQSLIHSAILHTSELLAIGFSRSAHHQYTRKRSRRGLALRRCGILYTQLSALLTVRIITISLILV